MHAYTQTHTHTRSFVCETSHVIDTMLRRNPTVISRGAILSRVRSPGSYLMRHVATSPNPCRRSGSAKIKFEILTPLMQTHTFRALGTLGIAYILDSSFIFRHAVMSYFPVLAPALHIPPSHLCPGPRTVHVYYYLTSFLLACTQSRIPFVTEMSSRRRARGVAGDRRRAGDLRTA